MVDRHVTPKKVPSARKQISGATRFAVLTEAGYRCAVPRCRMILTLNMHHIEFVSEGGNNKIENLVALCPYCHSLLHNGHINRRSLNIWKGVLISLTQAFDATAVDQLLFLHSLKEVPLDLSGDGLLSLSRIISAGLVKYKLLERNTARTAYTVSLTGKGRLLVKAWKEGNNDALTSAITYLPTKT